MPSLPSSAAPTATFVPFSTLRGSVVTSSPVGRNATTQSMRGHRGRRHAPPTFRYVGRLVVEKKPSGRTPSAGAGSKRASGACDSGGASKLGGRYWNRGRLTGWQNYVQRTDLRNVSQLRSEEHTSELQSRLHLVCRLLLEKKKKRYPIYHEENTPKLQSPSDNLKVIPKDNRRRSV